MSTRLHDAAGVAELVRSLTARLSSLLADERDLALVGVRRGGVALCSRIARDLRASGRKVDVGTVDIALYRDDAHLAWPRPEVGPTEILFDVEGRHVVIVDDVFWTGRTARAAMDAVLDFGRPRRLWLAALVARPGRELPIAPDAVALRTEVPEGAKVELRLVEDGWPEDQLLVVEGRAS